MWTIKPTLRGKVWGVREVIHIKLSFKIQIRSRHPPTGTHSVASLCTENETQLLSPSCKAFVTWPLPIFPASSQTTLPCSLSSRHTDRFSIQGGIFVPRACICCTAWSALSQAPCVLQAPVFPCSQRQAHIFKEESADHPIRCLP